METKAYLIIPVHNRKNVTLANLTLLRGQGIFDRHTIIVVDDGSTDGTSDAVAREFPKVTLLKGDGSLYWTGAIELGMRYAVDEGASCCVWLNDDLILSGNAIDHVVNLALDSGSIVTGQGVINYENGSQWFFPGLYRSRAGLVDKDLEVSSTEPLRVDTCRGNLVAIPLNIVNSIGFPDGKNIPHVAGDTDYVLRATAAGFHCVTLCEARFYETENIRTDNRSWLLDRRSPAEILRNVVGKRGILYPRMVFTYQTRHWGLRGLIRALKQYTHMLAVLTMKLIIPRKIRLKLFAHRSHAYKAYATRGIET